MSDIKTEELRKCENCGKEFRPKAFWQRWCSKACKQAAYRKRKDQDVTKR